MIEWNTQPTIRKEYANAVGYFTKQLAVMTPFKAAGGDALKKQGYKSTNVATKFQVACVAMIRMNRALTNEENKNHDDGVHWSDC